MDRGASTMNSNERSTAWASRQTPMINGPRQIESLSNFTLLERGENENDEQWALRKKLSNIDL